MAESQKNESNQEPQISLKVEVKEENVLGNDYLIAKGRLDGVLQQLTEHTTSESEDGSSDDAHPGKYKRRVKHEAKKRNENSLPVRSTYLMKLYDRSVDLAKFEEDTPLYPICRAWIANNSKKPHAVIKRRLSTPEPDVPWNNANVPTDINRLPPPTKPFITRIPSPTPAQRLKELETIHFDYVDGEMRPKDELLSELRDRWQTIKRKWVATAAQNENRFAHSKKILQTIYSKAQATLED